jgi:NTP pyrophosphatase (non-canonical NTP hydrolase)
MSTFKKIENWAKIFGLPVAEKEGFPQNEKELHLGLKLILEELDELKDALRKRDLTEVKDAGGDLIWVVTRLMQTCGIDTEKVLDAIYESNMSKSCKTIEEARESVKAYKEKGIPTFIKENNGFFFVHREVDSKLLKSINFKEPKF